MAFREKDGRAFGNRQQMKAYEDRVMPKKAASERNERNERSEPRDRTGEDEPEENEAPSQGEGPEEEGEGSDISHMDIGEAVQRHGPATEIHIRQSGTGQGGHHVITTHGGRRHTSMHPDADSAHIHAARASGLQPPEPPNMGTIEGPGGMNRPQISGMQQP